MPPTANRRLRLSAGRLLGMTGLLVWLAFVVTVGLHRQQLSDWLRLRNYTPPTSVTALVRDDTMTPAAQHLFYLNQPQIAGRSAFMKDCPQVEATIVLGCYRGDEAGIYVLKVTDSRLQGVEQVTAAHEMLHAAYDRLAPAERSRIDGLLTDYYQHGLQDSRIRDTIAVYQKSEPHDVVNEMHSVFGTEVADLPAPLEAYYRQYFSDRAAIVRYADDYQAEFVSRQETVAADDAQLTTWKQQITNDEVSLKAQQRQLDAQRTQLDAAKDERDAASYNRQVAAYNQAVDAYNADIVAVKQLIQQYNALVQERNAIALEEQQLVQALGGPSVSPIK